MKIGTLHIGMQVKHPSYGTGTVRSLNEHTAEIDFPDGRKTIAPETSELAPFQAEVTVSGLEKPLAHFVDEIVRAVIAEMGIEKDESVIEELGLRWHNGRMVLHPADSTLQTKEVPLEVFFHKVVMMRNNLRVLEQKINGHKALSEADKVEMQQYISRCYGTMTTFNVLFKRKEDQFTS